LSYNLDILDSDRKKILKRIGELITADNSYRLDNQEEIYSLSSYAFTNENYQIQSSIITLLGEISTKKSYEIMKDALINPIVFDRVKSGVIGFLVADGFEEEISVVFSNVFKKITLYRAEFDRNNGVFVEAYAYLYARLSHLEDALEPIKNSTEIIYKKLVEKDLIREIKDVKSLSAVIYELSSIADIKSRREFASFFDANLREIKRIKSLIL
jgi:glutathionyl-hydroquinone reductase